MNNRFLQREACEVAEISRITLGEWIRKGLIGNPPYSFAQITGLTIAVHLRERGCGLVIVEKVVKHFGRLSDELLEAHVAAGKKILITSLRGDLVYLCNEGDQFTPPRGGITEVIAIDIQEAFDRVKAFCLGIGEALAGDEDDADAEPQFE